MGDRGAARRLWQPSQHEVIRAQPRYKETHVRPLTRISDRTRSLAGCALWKAGMGAMPQQLELSSQNGGGSRGTVTGRSDLRPGKRKRTYFLWC